MLHCLSLIREIILNTINLKWIEKIFWPPPLDEQFAGGMNMGVPDLFCQFLKYDSCFIYITATFETMNKLKLFEIRNNPPSPLNQMVDILTLTYIKCRVKYLRFGKSFYNLYLKKINTYTYIWEPPACVLCWILGWELISLVTEELCSLFCMSNSEFVQDTYNVY